LSTNSRRARAVTRTAAPPPQESRAVRQKNDDGVRQLSYAELDWLKQPGHVFEIARGPLTGARVTIVQVPVRWSDCARVRFVDPMFPVRRRSLPFHYDRETGEGILNVGYLYPDPAPQATPAPPPPPPPPEAAHGHGADHR
jgi:hypothetical protein